MLCRYETPMAVKGIPDGGQIVRNILGKRSGQFQLREYPDGNVVAAGRLQRPQQVNPDRCFHAAVDGSGLYTDITALTGTTFQVDSIVPAIDEALQALLAKINNYNKGDIKRLWMPALLAMEILRYPRPGVRQLREFDPEREKIAEFDYPDLSARHEALGEKLAANCVGCNGRVYNVEPVPFIGVGVLGGEVVVNAEIVDAALYLLTPGNCVRIFSITEKEEAFDFAEKLARELSLKVGGYRFEFEGARPEFFTLDTEALQYRLVAGRLADRFNLLSHKMGTASVVLDMPLEAISIMRSLKAAMADPLWASRLDNIEAAVMAAIKYDEREGGYYFTNPKSVTQAIILEQWKDRAVHVDFSGPKSGL